MAYEEALKSITRVAGADLTAAQYRFVKGNGANGVIRCGTAGEKALGVLQNDPIQGEAATVAIDTSTTKVVAGGVIAQDAEVTTDNEGRAVAAAAGNFVLGTAQIAAGAAGEIISVLLQRGAAAKA